MFLGVVIDRAWSKANVIDAKHRCLLKGSAASLVEVAPLQQVQAPSATSSDQF